jgi:chloramphenicol-sensitive protein RarD
MIPRAEIVRGTWIAVGSFVIWGLAPLYWKLLEAVPAIQVVMHRVVWSAVFVGGYLFWRDGRHWLRQTLHGDAKLWWMLGLSGVLISSNWGLYIWAVGAGHVVESSLGYFINPLLNILFGVLFLRERLRPLQWLSVAIAAAGVLWLTVQHGRLPWIALALAVSFAIYSVLRKLARVDPVSGLGVEGAYLFLPVLAWLVWVETHGAGGFGAGYGAPATTLLVLAGIVTALPLIGFAYAVRRIPLTTIGIMQYIAPTLMFLCGLFIFHEPFDRTRLIGFACIWLALAVFIIDGLRQSRHTEAELAELV